MKIINDKIKLDLLQSAAGRNDERLSISTAQSNNMLADCHFSNKHGR